METRTIENNKLKITTIMEVDIETVHNQELNELNEAEYQVRRLTDELAIAQDRVSMLRAKVDDLKPEYDKVVSEKEEVVVSPDRIEALVDL